jgi:hypothetical protein
MTSANVALVDYLAVHRPRVVLPDDCRPCSRVTSWVDHPMECELEIVAGQDVCVVHLDPTVDEHGGLEVELRWPKTLKIGDNISLRAALYVNGVCVWDVWTTKDDEIFLGELCDPCMLHQLQEHVKLAFGKGREKNTTRTVTTGC